MSCKPKCNPASESTESQLNNFVLAFFGSLTKTCVNGQVVWQLPGDLSAGLPCYPRIPNEGLASYFIRIFELFGLVASGNWDVNVTYCDNAFVTYGGQGYVAIQAGIGHQPDISPTFWTLYIQKGLNGVNIPSPLTTKGDIWGYDVADNRIPVGADNSALIADSTQALGVRWGLPPSSDTASNLGAGSGVFASKAGNDYQFKSLISGAGITITPSGTALTISSGGGGGSGPAVILQDQKATGTAGGTFTQGAWRTRDMNTVVYDPGAVITLLAGNQFTPIAGTYFLYAIAPANQVERNLLRLQNITDAVTEFEGIANYNPNTSDDTNCATIVGTFTTDGTKVYELQHQCELTRAANGFGIETSFGSSERYATIMLW